MFIKYFLKNLHILSGNTAIFEINFNLKRLKDMNFNNLNTHIYANKYFISQVDGHFVFCTLAKLINYVLSLLSDWINSCYLFREIYLFNNGKPNSTPVYVFKNMDVY